MTGIEYELLHAMEPILYVIRKQNRQTPTQGLQSVINELLSIFTSYSAYVSNSVLAFAVFVSFGIY